MSGFEFRLRRQGVSVLGWQPRPWQDAVVATAESLLRFRAQT